jgi:hypothetical protein
MLECFAFSAWVWVCFWETRLTDLIPLVVGFLYIEHAMRKVGKSRKKKENTSCLCYATLLKVI